MKWSLALALAALVLLVFDVGAPEEALIGSPRQHAREIREALDAGELVAAEVAIEMLRMTQAPALDAGLHFLRGEIAHRRGERAEIVASGPEAGIPDIELAIRHVEEARDAFLAAHLAEPEDAAARRNCQRAVEKLIYLKKRKEILEETRKKRGNEKEGQAEPELIEEERLIEAELRELAPAALARILERLAEKENEKAELRREMLHLREAKGGRDW